MVGGGAVGERDRPTSRIGAGFASLPVFGGPLDGGSATVPVGQETADIPYRDGGRSLVAHYVADGGRLVYSFSREQF